MSLIFKNSLTLIFTICLTLCSMSLSSCNATQESDSNIELTDSVSMVTEVEFETPLRPGIKVWDINQTFIDIVEFDKFETNYDYWYAVFITSEGEFVWVAYDDSIDEALHGSKFQIEWKIDSLYEAGDGDALYYKERLLAYTKIADAPDLSGIFLDFFSAWVSDNQPVIDEFKHPELELSHAFNPGAMCVLGMKSPYFGQQVPAKMIVKKGFPNGDFCDGYPRVASGLYFETILADELPEYYFEDDDEFYTRMIDYPKIEGVEDIYKVIIILDEYHAGYLYFVEVADKIYIWHIDQCDCSA